MSAALAYTRDETLCIGNAIAYMREQYGSTPIEVVSAAHILPTDSTPAKVVVAFSYTHEGTARAFTADVWSIGGKLYGEW